MQDIRNERPPSLGARLYAVFHLHDPADPVSRIVDGSVVAVVCCASLMAWLNLGGAIGEAGGRWTYGLEMLATVVLTLEYIVRIAVAGYGPQGSVKHSGWRYIRSPLGLIDLIAILPAWLSLFFPVNLGISLLMRLFRLAVVLPVFKPQWAEFRAANHGNSLREQIYNLLFLRGGGGRLHDLIERFLIGAVVASVLILSLETVPSLRLRFAMQFTSLGLLIGAVFLLEYGLRLYSATCDPRYASPLMGRLRFAATPGAVIDLLALLPLLFFFAGWDLALFPALRMIRMLRLVRHLNALALIFEIVREERATLLAAMSILVVLTTLAGVSVYFAEHATQPDRFSSIPTSMYWAVMTLTSIGYGDIYPVTAVGRAMTMILAVGSLGMVALPAGIIATAFSERLRQPKTQGRARDGTTAGVDAARDPVDRVAGILRGLNAEERALLLAILDAEASRIRREGGTD